MKIATYNINGIIGRLPTLLRWLEEDAPDVVCLQELKTSDDKFPQQEIECSGYRAVWHGQKSWNGVAILARDVLPVLTRQGLPGDPDDRHSRYIEAAINGLLVCCLYLPNGNPAPGPKFDYKLRWFDRLHQYAGELLDLNVPTLLIGDFNVMPTDMDVYSPERWRDDASEKPMAGWFNRDGRMHFATFTRTNESTPSGNTGETHSNGTRDCGSTIFFSVPTSLGIFALPASDAIHGAGTIRAIMRPS